MYVEWCMGASIVLSALALIIAVTKNDTDGSGSGGIAIIIVSTGSLLLLVAGLVIFKEPQIIKEQAVKVGVGKFLADEKGHVDFYFVKPDGTLIECELHTALKGGSFTRSLVFKSPPKLGNPYSCRGIHFPSMV